ncbi:nuclear transport factor 2 family protein [uncultured Mucilaginibacter sp.]|uniref:nuclear transport factor 2 family protein n=1 Tax=uncultured Mucilaginibacter sp. TaxID=797541 RepID=UPI00261A9CAA|nr:nuclear transport factor 2 family protein [uncultured Mucilaginibacter sp.]
MKTTIKTAIIALLLTVTYNFTKAAEPNANEKLTMRYAIAAYVDAFAHGRFDGLAEVVDDSAKFSQTRGQKILSFSKNDILESLKGQQNVEQNCKTTSQIVENTGNLVVYKVQMKYENFARINYVTMTDTGAGWKITNVSTVFN